MGNNTGQVDCCFHTGVTTTNHRYAFTLKQRAIAVRAVGNPFVPVLFFARHIHFTPAGTGRQNDRFAFQYCATLQGDFNKFGAPLQLGSTLQVHDIHVIFFDVLFQCDSQFRAFGLFNRDEVFDTHGIQHLTTETFGNHTGTDTFTGRINGRSGSCRATADNQHVKRGLVIDFGSFTLCRAGIQLGNNFFQSHATLAEHFAVQEHSRYRHDLPCIDFILEQGAIDHDMTNSWVDHSHQVQCLHHIRAVLTA